MTENNKEVTEVTLKLTPLELGYLFSLMVKQADDPVCRTIFNKIDALALSLYREWFMADDKNRFAQHIPDFCDGLEAKEFDFNTTEELLENKLISDWTKSHEFHKFSINENRLMCELEKGKKFYVLGYIEHPEKVNLPKWEYIK